MTTENATSKEAARGCCAWSLLIFVFMFIVQLVFVILKATGSVDWTLAVTLSPLTVFIAIHLIIYAGIGAFAMLDKV